MFVQQEYNQDLTNEEIKKQKGFVRPFGELMKLKQARRDLAERSDKVTCWHSYFLQGLAAGRLAQVIDEQRRSERGRTGE